MSIAAIDAKPRILFCSHHCYADPSSGAALSMRDLLVMLSDRGWECRVLCGAQLDYEIARGVDQLLAEQGWHGHVRRCDRGPMPFALHRLIHDGIPLGIYSPEAREAIPGIAEGYPFLAMLDRLLTQFKPDLLLTYGGHWLTRAIIAVAKLHAIPVVFWLRNCEYKDPVLFESVDGVIVPCQFSREHYRRALGLECDAIASPVDWRRVQCEAYERRFLTFVNPQPSKGVFFFARIAEVLGRTRSDIPLLVVEGRGGASWLGQTGIDLGRVGSLFVMPNTPDPRQFYRMSRAVLMPSLWKETFARVPVEAFINGIPVLASRRGGLVENLAEGGVLLDIPQRYTEHTHIVPTAEEVGPWVRAIIQLWDDPKHYEAERQRCLRAAEAFRAEHLMPQYEAVFRAVMATKREAAEAKEAASVIHTVAGFVEGKRRDRVGELSQAVLDELLTDPTNPGLSEVLPTLPLRTSIRPYRTP